MRLDRLLSQDNGFDLGILKNSFWVGVSSWGWHSVREEWPEDGLPREAVSQETSFELYCERLQTALTKRQAGI